MTHPLNTIKTRKLAFATGTASHWVSFIRLFNYAFLTIFLVPFQVVNLLFFPSKASFISTIHHKLASHVLGLQIKVEGSPTKTEKALFVANHISYLDIVAIGSIVPGRFIAKQELSTWPVFGILAKLTRTIFISRSSSSALKQLQLIKHLLFQSERLILFPEGTSSDGRKVLPFKPSLFEAPIKADAIVQPLTIRYEKINGMPVDRRSKPFLAWYGDMDLLPHLWQSLSLGTITIKLVFHEPIKAVVFRNRKKLANHCQKIIAFESEKPYR